MISLSIRGPCLGMFFQKGYGLGNGPREINIIRIQPGQIFTVGPPPPLIDRVRLPLVLLRNPIKTMVVGIKHIHGLIR
jgi:hypothetical protein